MPSPVRGGGWPVRWQNRRARDPPRETSTFREVGETHMLPKSKVEWRISFVDGPVHEFVPGLYDVGVGNEGGSRRL